MMPYPLSYIFKVCLGQDCFDVSPELHLLTNVIVGMEGGEEQPLADGTECHLIDAFGNRHVAHARQGEIKFERVIVGPMQLKSPSEIISIHQSE